MSAICDRFLESRLVKAIQSVVLVYGLAGAALAYADESPSASEAGETSELKFTANLETWGSATRNEIRKGSVTNPGNNIAALPAYQLTADTRMNGRAEYGALEAVFNFRWVAQENWANSSDLYGGSTDRRAVNKTIVDQGFLRYKSDLGTVVLGRELLTWGPAKFRSPSNPIYFDAGRTNPLATIAGLDLARATLDFDNDWRLTLAQVFNTDKVVPPVDGDHTTLFKLDHQGSAHLISLIVAKQREVAPFFGGFAQATVNDALLLYGEAGSQILPYQLNIAPAPAYYRIDRPGPRRTTALLGASYTVESGQVLGAEYLYNNSGLGKAGEKQYFAQAANIAGAGLDQYTAYGLLGQNLAYSPGLLGRHYLYLTWESNPQETLRYWRVGWAQNLTDGSGQLQGYYERGIFAPHVSGFVLAAVNTGNVRKEFSQYLSNSVMVGVKIFWF